MKALLLLSVACLSGCVEVSALVGPRYANRQDPEIALNLEISKSLGKHGKCSYVHSSEIAHGAPFNSDDEIATETIACGARWGD